MKRVTKRHLITCVTCEQRFPKTMFAEEGICVYCASKAKKGELEAEKPLVETPKQRQAREQQEIRNARLAAMKRLEEERERKRKLEEEINVQMEAKKELAQRQLAANNLLAFTKRYNQKYKAGWVHRDICEKLEWFSAAIAAGESPRLILTMPPRHGKSELASRNFPAWHLGKYPDHEVITCSYAATLASGFSKKVREMCRDSNFNKLFPEFALDMEAQSVEHWMTKQGGGLAAAGVGGPITGKGAHVLIIDDPIKNRDEAESVSTRESIWNWFTSTAYTRLAPGGGVLCIQTRWHDDDLAGRLITRSEEDEENTEDWVVVNYPAIAVTDELYRKQGEALHNDRYPLPTLERIRKTIGNRDFSALYQQNPVPENGELFTSGMVRYYKQSELPDFETMNFYTAWDLAIGQKETNDRTVGITVGVDAKLDIWVVDIRIGRWGSMEIVDRILDTYQAWRSTVTGIEKGQIEMSIRPILNERMRERKLSSMFVEDLRTGRQDKVARSRPIIARMQQGRVFFPSEHPLVMEVINELLRFPNGVHDDCADALSWIGWLLEYFTAVRPAKQKPKKSWRDKLGKFMRTTNTKSHMGS